MPGLVPGIHGLLAPSFQADPKDQTRNLEIPQAQLRTIVRASRARE
jgi:hypothetical protein